MSSIQHQEPSYLAEDLEDQHEEALLISQIASHGQQFASNGNYFFRRKSNFSSDLDNLSTKPDRLNHLDP